MLTMLTLQVEAGGGWLGQRAVAATAPETILQMGIRVGPSRHLNHILCSSKVAGELWPLLSCSCFHSEPTSSQVRFLVSSTSHLGPILLSPQGIQFLLPPAST